MAVKKIEMIFTWETSVQALEVEHKDIPGSTHVVVNSFDPDLGANHWREVSKILHTHLDDMLRVILNDINLIP